MWEQEIKHDGLHKRRLIRGTDQHVVEQQAVAQLAYWDELWHSESDKEKWLLSSAGPGQASDRSRLASETLTTLQNILSVGMKQDKLFHLKSLEDHSPFNKPRPQLSLSELPDEPRETDRKYRPYFNALDHLFTSRYEKRKKEARDLFEQDKDTWLEQKAGLERDHKKDIEKWDNERHAFLQRRKEKNNAIKERLLRPYLERMPDAVVFYFEHVLSCSKYPPFFPQEFNIEYNPETKILLVDYSLPSPDSLPKVKEAKYVKSKNEIVESFYSESFLNKLYDDMTYQITLRTIWEIYKTDAAQTVDSVVFNGWVESIDKATGHKTNGCILSIQASRDEFLAINLENVDPKTCFKGLKGIGSSKLHNLTPLAPILNMSKEDKRFISSYAVATGLDESINIAAMDWEDFEHLIREIFEKEFSQYGGEVKITQASHDRGVDAVAFDPDPVRGGKIVIQAKRYTNAVGVAAVRDLYGTVINEGAMKGILISTAEYGPDAYEFARGKPLTLLNGGNLLHMLEKHGHKARIDLKAAKQLLAEKNEGP